MNTIVSATTIWKATFSDVGYYLTEAQDVWVRDRCNCHVDQQTESRDFVGKVQASRYQVRAARCSRYYKQTAELDFDWQSKFSFILLHFILIFWCLYSIINKYIKHLIWHKIIWKWLHEYE